MAYLSLLLGPLPSFCSRAGLWQVTACVGPARRTGLSSVCSSFHSTGLSGAGRDHWYLRRMLQSHPGKGAACQASALCQSLKSDCSGSSPSPASYKPSNSMVNPGFCTWKVRMITAETRNLSRVLVTAHAPIHACLHRLCAPAATALLVCG